MRPTTSKAGIGTVAIATSRSVLLCHCHLYLHGFILQLYALLHFCGVDDIAHPLLPPHRHKKFIQYAKPLLPYLTSPKPPGCRFCAPACLMRKHTQRSCLAVAGSSHRCTVSRYLPVRQAARIGAARLMLLTQCFNNLRVPSSRSAPVPNFLAPADTDAATFVTVAVGTGMAPWL